MKFGIVFSAAFLALMMFAPMAGAQATPESTPGKLPPVINAPVKNPAGKLAMLRRARYSACLKKSAGDPCSFSPSSPGGQPITGECRKSSRGELLCSAKPEGTAGGSKP